MCLYPKLVNNPKYQSNKKNGGVIPAFNDSRVTLVPIGCGKCMECMKKRAREWQVRLLEEIKDNNKAKFVTLTFSNEAIAELANNIEGLEGYDLDNAIAKLAVRRFLERWRKKYKKSVRHWLVTELGHSGTENIHLHGILWTEESEETIKDIWKYGFIWTNERNGGVVGEKVVNYIIKYCTKIDEKHQEYKSVILTSQGIGRGYVNRLNSKANIYNKDKTKEYYVTNSGFKIALPIYYRNKIYTEEQREKLWLNKLDKKERFVNGVRVDVSKGEEMYYKVLKEARVKNKRLGYLDNKIDWERRKYERDLRNLKFKERTKDIKIKTKNKNENSVRDDIRNRKYNYPED